MRYERWCFFLRRSSTEKTHDQSFCHRKYHAPFKGGLISNTSRTSLPNMLIAERSRLLTRLRNASVFISHSQQAPAERWFLREGKSLVGRRQLRPEERPSHQNKAVDVSWCNMLCSSDTVCFAQCTHTTPSSILKRGEAYQL